MGAMKWFFKIVIILGLIAFWFTSDQAVAKIDLKPYKATYDLSLVSAKRNSQLVDVKGSMNFIWGDECDAWTTRQDYQMRYDYVQGMPAEITNDFAAWEAKDGSLYTFASKRYRGNVILDDIRGQATKKKDGSFDIVYKRPMELTYQGNLGTLLPTEHSVQMIKHAMAGKKFFPAVLFDGSDEDGPVEVSAFISGKVDVADTLKKNEKVDQSLLNSVGWNTRMAFFARGDSEEQSTSDYEMTMTIHENGVISDMLIDYDDFSLQGTLISLEPLDIPKCD